MAWSWSHTVGAYANAQAQVESQEREWLEVVYAEWQAAEFDDNMRENKQDLSEVVTFYPLTLEPYCDNFSPSKGRQTDRCFLP